MECITRFTGWGDYFVHKSPDDEEGGPLKNFFINDLERICTYAVSSVQELSKITEQADEKLNPK
jgi:hypothetical protein